jgi:hypothetical protein
MNKEQYIRGHVRDILMEEMGDKKFISAVDIANELVNMGVIKDEYTDLSGKKASSNLAFIIRDVFNKLGI